MHFIVSKIHGLPASGSEKAREASGDVIHTNCPVVVPYEPLKVSILVKIHTWKLNWHIAKNNF
jgi:hypothetical protein